MGAFDGCYATDADLAAESMTEFPLLLSTPVLASGRDGVFTQDDPWTLVSVSNNFQTQGLQAGHVIQLRDLGGMGELGVPYKDQLLEVVSVEGGAAVLKPVGLAAGMGLAPGALGEIVEVRFYCATAYPLLLRASDDIRRILRIDDDEDDLESVGDPRRACVMRVLCDLFADRAREAEEGDKPQWSGKANRACKSWREELESLKEMYWPSGPGGGDGPVAGPLDPSTDPLGKYPYEGRDRAYVDRMGLED